MKPARKTSRRSFLLRVGATATAGAALALVGGPDARAQNVRYTGVTDCDSGNNHDRPGYGTGNRNRYTDSDTGPAADPRCGGRGSNSESPTGTQYIDRRVHTGCSDSDDGPNGDPSGYGTRCRGRDNGYGAPRVSGCSDNDPASTGDSVGNGRHCTPR